MRCCRGPGWSSATRIRIRGLTDYRDKGHSTNRSGLIFGHVTITKQRAQWCPMTNGIVMKRYEAPTLDEIGSVADVTRGEGLQGSDDSFQWFIFKIDYGTDPSSG